MTTRNTNLEIPNSEIETKPANIASTGTDTQILRVPHADPSAARVKWLKLYIHNTAAAAAEVLFWDEDLTAGAISTNSKQGDNTVAGCRFRVTVGVDSQVVLTQEQLPGLWWQAGIAARSDAVNTHIVVEYAKSVS